MERSRVIFIALCLGMIALTVIFTVVTAGPIAVPALVIFAAASACYLLPRHVPAGAALLLYAAMALSVVVLYWLVSTTPLALFLIAALASWRELRWRVAAVLACATGAHVIVQLALGQDTVLTGLATVGGVVFFYLVGRLLASEKMRREQITQLLLDVEQSRQAEKESYLMAERGRMARDLHDVLAHTLSGLTIQLEAARLLASKECGASPLRDAVENAHRLSRTGLQEARRAVATLRGDQIPGPDQIATLVEEHRLSTNGAVRFTARGDPRPLDADASLAIYRTAQEALSNVRKHARGAAVAVSVEWSSAFVTLTVEDDGTVRQGPPTEGGYGLTGMAERAELLGASLETGPCDSGFRVRLAVPIERTLRDR
ncbi:sensor histidine kinase [Glutamicibacter protophormiae]|uniref:sensor histidine kinase n=1 Tax=Glutamicibacter protophormiae TaxID=37930 RepID=UPI003A8F0776